MTPKTSMSTVRRICCPLLSLVPIYDERSSRFRRFHLWLGSVLLWLGIIVSCYVLFLIMIWLIFNPEDPKFIVTNASLTQFNLNSSTSDSTRFNLHYQLALNITIRNPNTRVGIYYRSMTVSPFYRQNMFGLVSLTSFYQGHKNTTLLPHAVFQGQQQLVKFGEHDISQFDKETAAGLYSITLQVIFRARIRYGKLKVNFLKPQNDGDQYYNCYLKLPLSLTNETSADAGFKVTKCDHVLILTLPQN